MFSKSTKSQPAAQSVEIERPKSRPVARARVKSPAGGKTYADYFEPLFPDTPPPKKNTAAKMQAPSEPANKNKDKENSNPASSERSNTISPSPTSASPSSSFASVSPPRTRTKPIIESVGQQTPEQVFDRYGSYDNIDDDIDDDNDSISDVGDDDENEDREDGSEESDDNNVLLTAMKKDLPITPLSAKRNNAKKRRSRSPSKKKTSMINQESSSSSPRNPASEPSPSNNSSLSIIEILTILLSLLILSTSSIPQQLRGQNVGVPINDLYNTISTSVTDNFMIGLINDNFVKQMYGEDCGVPVVKLYDFVCSLGDDFVVFNSVSGKIQELIVSNNKEFYRLVYGGGEGEGKSKSVVGILSDVVASSSNSNSKTSSDVWKANNVIKFTSSKSSKTQTNIQGKIIKYTPLTTVEEYVQNERLLDLQSLYISNHFFERELLIASLTASDDDEGWFKLKDKTTSKCLTLNGKGLIKLNSCTNVFAGSALFKYDSSHQLKVRKGKKERCFNSYDDNGVKNVLGFVTDCNTSSGGVNIVRVV